MSILRSVIRMCAVSALRDHTWAGERCFDSDNSPLVDALIKEGTKPYITVYTDEDRNEAIDGRDVYTGTRRISLVLEMGLASSVEVENKGRTLQIPQTDQAMEATVDFIEAQALSALFTNPYSPFGEILKQIVNKFSRVVSIRGGAADQGVRWAARQVTFVCETIADPPPGIVLDARHPIMKFIALARLPENAELQMVEASNLIETLLNETEIPDFRQAQAWLALTNKGIRGTGLAPLNEEDEVQVQLLVPMPIWNEDLQTRVPTEDHALFAPDLINSSPVIGTPSLQ